MRGWGGFALREVWRDKGTESVAVAAGIDRENLIEVGVLLAEAERRRCLRDSEYFVKRFCGGWSEATGQEFGGEEWPGQKRLREAYLENQRVIGVKAAGVGWDWESSWLALWEVLKGGREIDYMCQRLENAERWLRMYVKWGAQRIRKETGWYPEIVRDRSNEIGFSNGSAVKCFPGDANALSGMHPALVIVSEWAIIEQPAAMIIFGRIGSKGKVLGFSTGRGMGNEFADVYVDARDMAGKAYGFKRVFAGWRDNLSLEERPLAPENLQAQEYPEDEMQPFSLFVGRVYPSELIAKAQVPQFAPDPAWEFVISHDPGLTGAAWLWGATDVRGCLYIFDAWLPEEEIINNQVMEAKSRWTGLEIRRKVIDRAAYARQMTNKRKLSDEYADLGMVFEPGQSDKFLGTNRILRLMQTGRLKIAAHLTGLLRQLGEVSYKAGRPDDSDQHGVAALRYLVNAFWKPGFEREVEEMRREAPEWSPAWVLERRRMRGMYLPGGVRI